MFGKFKTILEYAGHYQKFADHRRSQLDVEEKIDLDIQKCTKTTRLEYFRHTRQLNRAASQKGYALDISDTPAHIMQISNDIDDIQKIMINPATHICSNTWEAIAHIRSIMKKYDSI